jgi:hypothetical protein|nr:MAG TPA: hypothetical protein [Caudoviricetes sp.]
MKTVFKVEQKVFDYAYGKGEVIERQNSRYLDNIILVKFNNRDVPVRYTLDGRQINIRAYGGELDPENVANKPTLSTEEYTLHGFEQKAPTPTYEEVVKDKNYIYLPENLVAPNKELADATMALLKLLFLRDYYNEGWSPNYIDNNRKFIIFVTNDEFDKDFSISESNILTFKSEVIRDKFFEEQKELLEIAKPLL